jgi:hypothetical protein
VGVLRDQNATVDGTAGVTMLAIIEISDSASRFSILQLVGVLRDQNGSWDRRQQLEQVSLCHCTFILFFAFSYPLNTLDSKKN